LRINFTEIDATEGFIGELTDDVKIYPSLNGLAKDLIDGICNKMLEDGDGEKARAFIYGSLVVLLSTLSGNQEQSAETEGYSDVDDTTHSFISHVLKYIDQNLTGNISAESVAKRMNVSLSTLSHIFKKHMGISLHRYVVQKRLILAQRLISEGHKPTKVYIDCGYRDYSSFYKAYIKMFGSLPSKEKK
jgi:AraC-like DNA-binding protein